MKTPVLKHTERDHIAKEAIATERAISRRASFAGGSVPRAVLTQAIPNILGLLVVSAYSLADSFFVSRLGDRAGAAVGLCFSILVLLQAVGYTLGMGGGSLVSRALGRGDFDSATAVSHTAIRVSLLTGILIAVGGIAFTEPILRLLGATEEALPEAAAYARPLFLAAPSMCAGLVVSQLLRARGQSTRSMLGLLLGSLVNILLDPLLIARFGIAGASLATLAGQTAGLCLLLWLQGALGHRRGAKASVVRITVAGLPSLFRQGLSGLATVLLTHAAADIGEEAVIAFSTVSRLFLLSFAFCLGIGQGMMPVAGYCLGADKPHRAHRAFLFSVKAATGVMLLLSIPLFFFAPELVGLFGSGEGVTAIGAPAWRAQATVLVTHGLVTCTILFLQAAGHSIAGTVLASARQGIFFLPLILLLPRWLGVWGLLLVQPLSDLLALLLAIPFFLWARKLTASKKAPRLDKLPSDGV